MRNTNHRSAQACRGAAVILLWLFIHATWGQPIISGTQIRPDKACGPRCLLALMKITGVGRQDCDLKRIYDIIGKEPLSPTSLKDLRDAARQLGFSAEGQKVDITQLKAMQGYAIVAVALEYGAKDPFLHFVLVKRVTDAHAILVEPTTLTSRALPLSELQKISRGYAVLLASADGKQPLPKPSDDPNDPLGPTVDEAGPPDQAWDFGIVDGGATLEHTFVVHRAAAGPCKIEVLKRSCTCLGASLGEDTSGNTTLTMKFHVKAPAWQKASAQVTFDPPNVVKVYTVMAYGRATFRVEPSEGYMEAGDRAITEYPVTVYYFTDVNDFAVFSRVKTDLAGVTAGAVRTERTAGDPRNPQTAAFTFHVPLLYQAGPPAGSPRTTAGMVEVAFDTAKGERLASLQVTIKTGTERVRVFPEKVFLMASKTEAPPQRQIRLEFLKQPYPANVTARVEGDPPVTVRCTHLADNLYVAHVAVPADSLENCPPGTRKGAISLVPDGGQEPIHVPVTVFVR